MSSAQLRILPPVAVGSAFLNNTPLMAMIVPVIRDISQAARLAGSKLYIPLSFASILGAIVMTNVITDAAAAAFMFPVALSMASDLGVSFMPFAMILMLGTSYAFINPAGYQTNLMVQKPGGYTFTDFVKVGLPLTVLVGVVAILLAPLVYGF